jgi:hypothetical protein
LQEQFEKAHEPAGAKRRAAMLPFGVQERPRSSATPITRITDSAGQVMERPARAIAVNAMRATRTDGVDADFGRSDRTTSPCAELLCFT